MACFRIPHPPFNFMATETEKDLKDGKDSKEAAKVEAKVEAPPVLTEAELEQQRDLLVRRTFGMPEPAPVVEEETAEAIAEREAKEKAEAEAKAKAEIDKVGDKGEKKTEKPPKGGTPSVAKKKLPKLPEPDEEADAEKENEIAERVAVATAEKLAAKMAPKAAATPETEKLTPKASKTLEIMEAMAKEKPEYKELATKTKEFWRKQTAYAEKWEKEHPGEVFNREADEHDDFYKKHEPAFDQDDFDEARVELVATRIADKNVAERLKPLTEAQNRREAQEKMHREAAEVQTACYDAVKATFQDVLPDLVKTIADKDGKFELDEATVAKIREEDPAAARIMDQTADKLGLCITELERLTRYPDHYQLQPDWKVALKTTGETFYPHREVHETGVKLEAALAGLSPENSMVDGKKFLTMTAWSGRLQRIVDSGKTATEKDADFKKLNQQYYRLTSDLIAERLASDLGRQAKAKLAEINELTDFRLKKNGAASTRTAAVEEVLKPGVVKERIRPPAAVEASPVVDSGAKPPQNEEERMALLNTRVF